MTYGSKTCKYCNRKLRRSTKINYGMANAHGTCMQKNRDAERKAKNESFAKSESLVDQIMRYESGEMNEPEMIELFQTLVNNGMAWSLQGSYGRTAKAMIEAGLVTA